MDELNVYSLLDLLRALSPHMQVVVTTGRSELFHLARAKFSCLNSPAATRFRAYRLTWDSALCATRLQSL